MSDQYGGPWQDPRAGGHPQYPSGQPSPAGYGWGTTPYPPAPPPPPPRKRRVHPAVIVVAGVVAAAAIVGVLVAVLAKGEVVDAPGTGGRSLAIPASIPGFPAVKDVNTDDLLANLGEELAQDDEDPEDVVRHGAVGVFDQQSTGSRVAFVGIALRDIASLRGQVRSDGVESTVKFFLAGAGENAGAGRRSTPFSPGPLKGFLRCSQGNVSGEPATVCGWGDESAFALTIFTKQPTLERAAADTRTLRAAIERP